MTPNREQLRVMAHTVLAAQVVGDWRFGDFIRRMVAATNMSPTMILARVKALAA